MGVRGCIGGVGEGARGFVGVRGCIGGGAGRGSVVGLGLGYTREDGDGGVRGEKGGVGEANDQSTRMRTYS